MIFFMKGEMGGYILSVRNIVPVISLHDIINKLKLMSNKQFDVIIPLPILREVKICSIQ